MWRDIVGLALAATLLFISKTAADTLSQSQGQLLIEAGILEAETATYSFPADFPAKSTPAK